MSIHTLLIERETASGWVYERREGVSAGCYQILMAAKEQRGSAQLPLSELDTYSWDFLSITYGANAVEDYFNLLDKLRRLAQGASLRVVL